MATINDPAFTKIWHEEAGKAKAKGTGVFAALGTAIKRYQAGPPTAKPRKAARMSHGGSVRGGGAGGRKLNQELKNL